jgi:2-(1,2-epoxy-1,2-dihydrophenyl)acetyl-CoA isomerase
VSLPGSAQFPDITYEVADRVALICLDRPKNANAVTNAMQSSYSAAIAAAGNDRDVVAIVVTGNGKVFCAGADLELLQGDALGLAGDIDLSIRAVLAPLYVDKPVIAAINGGIAGMGFSMALACDIRFAAEGAKFTTAFAQRGLVAEYGSSALLPRIVSFGRSMDLLLSGRTFSAEQAHAYGLVEEIYPPDDVRSAALDYARTLVRRTAPTSLAIIKRQLIAAADLQLRDTLTADRALMPSSWLRPDLTEGVDAFRERRDPHFMDLDRALVPDLGTLT